MTNTAKPSCVDSTHEQALYPIKFRRNAQARLVSSEAQLQELQAHLTAVEQERAHLRAQVETLDQLVSRGASHESDRTGNGDADARAMDLERRLRVSSVVSAASA